MQSLHTGPSQFSGVESIKLTANASQITIKDSPDNQVHAAKSGGAQLVMKQDGGLLKVTGNAAQFELQVPPGVPVAITSNVSTINDQRAQPITDCP